MRVERVEFEDIHGSKRDRFEILLGDIVYVKSIEDAKKLADWIYELLNDDEKPNIKRIARELAGVRDAAELIMNGEFSGDTILNLQQAFRNLSPGAREFGEVE